MSDQEQPKFEEITPALTRVLLTPERIEAVRRAIKALYDEQQEYMGVNTYPTKRDFEIESAVAILEEMIAHA